MLPVCLSSYNRKAKTKGQVSDRDVLQPWRSTLQMVEDLLHMAVHFHCHKDVLMVLLWRYGYSPLHRRTIFGKEH